MAFQGINTGSAPNDGTGDTLLAGGIKVNSNFTEIYSLLGDGSSLAVGVVTNTGDASGVTGITTLIQAGSNISVTTNAGISTIAYTGIANTANISANTVNVSGIVTATSFNGSGASLTGVLTALNLNGADGSGLTGVVTTLTGANASGVTGITTLIQAGSNITVTTTAGITTIASTASGVGTANVSTNTLVVAGVSTFQGRMIGTDTNNVIPFYYNNYSEFPSSSTYHGAVAHAHNTGRLYFAHAGWKELVNKESDGTVGTGTETYNVGLITAIGNNLVSSQWTLGASGSSHYTFTGPGNLSGTSDPVIYLARGQTYQFVNNSGGSHPFEIRTSNGGSAYSTGVTNNSAASGVIKFEVPFDAPNTLYYQCTNHAGMGGTVVVYPDRFTV
tara:strand:+ start:4143 stop:5309 length:1167 start_codon:yes stop_codon:yes gene_type:complete